MLVNRVRTVGLLAVAVGGSWYAYSEKSGVGKGPAREMRGVKELLKKQGGVAVLDGGLGTAMESAGADLDTHACARGRARARYDRLTAYCCAWLLRADATLRGRHTVTDHCLRHRRRSSQRESSNSTAET